jgi:hypothetical protein
VGTSITGYLIVVSGILIIGISISGITVFCALRVTGGSIVGMIGGPPNLISVFGTLI